MLVLWLFAILWELMLSQKAVIKLKESLMSIQWVAHKIQSSSPSVNEHKVNPVLCVSVHLLFSKITFMHSKGPFSIVKISLNFNLKSPQIFTTLMYPRQICFILLAESITNCIYYYMYVVYVLPYGNFNTIPP